MKAVNAGAARLWRVANGFTRMAETWVEGYSDDPKSASLGKRKRLSDGQLTADPLELLEAPTDLSFLRPRGPLQHVQSTHDKDGAVDSGVTLDESETIDSNGGAVPAEGQVGGDVQTSTSHSADMQDQMRYAAGQGPLDFDWVLWDQWLQPNFDLGFEEPNLHGGNDSSWPN